jgi:hypothetical protein
MSPLWNIPKAIIKVEGPAMHKLIYDEWYHLYLNSETEDFMAFQHYVQRQYPDIYKRCLAYARLMGWD